MVISVAAEKHGQTFDFLDVDRDGYLERADFEAIAARLADGAEADDRETVLAAYLKFWECLAVEPHVAEDGRISREQYIAGLDTIAKSNPPDEAIVQMPIAILAIYDHDRDGKLNEKEFLAMQAALGVAEDKARIALLAIDRRRRPRDQRR